MKYHAYVRLSEAKYFFSCNETEETVINKLVIPFINGQVIEADNSNGKKITTLVNMKSAVSLSLYATEDEVNSEEFFPGGMVSESCDEFDCTHQFIEKVKELQSVPATRSLLQMATQSPQKQVFVVMKFGDKLLDSAYQGVIKPISSEFGLAAVRVDEIQDSGRINDQILENIAKSRIIISDLSGERPNCYYETGFAHALGKEIILTIHKDSDIHFDLASHRFIQWETENELRILLKARFEAILNT